MTPLRLVLVTRRFWPLVDECENLLARLAAELAQQGASVTVLTARTQAAWPAPWLAAHKFWPPVGRVDNVYGDRHLMCTCPSVESLAAGESSE